MILSGGPVVGPGCRLVILKIPKSFGAAVVLYLGCPEFIAFVPKYASVFGEALFCLKPSSVTGVLGLLWAC